MKKIMFKMFAAIAMMIGIMTAGCTGTTELPTVEKMQAVAKAVGYTAGYACELSKTKTEVKEAIATVLDAASIVVPDTNTTFTAAWTPVMTNQIAALVKANKITADQATVVTTCAKAAVTGLDYVFTKYPKAREAQDLVSAAVKSFIEGYKSVVTVAADPKNTITLDDEALKAIKAAIQPAKPVEQKK